MASIGDTMTRKEIIRRLYTRKELNTLAKKATEAVEENLNSGNYRMTAIYTYDLAQIYELLGDEKKAENHYESAIAYLSHAHAQPILIKLGSLCALGRVHEALKAELGDDFPSEFWLAFLHEKAGNHDTAKQLYTELALSKSKTLEMVTFFYPHSFQEASDLWMRAQNMEKAHTYNKRAVEEWEKIKDTIVRLYPIEEAWLYEEIGYIYEKAHKFETAMEYYKKSESKYKLAYTKRHWNSTSANQVDGDWDRRYREYFFKQLFPENRFIDLTIDTGNHDFRRIKYRILNLEEWKSLSVSKNESKKEKD